MFIISYIHVHIHVSLQTIAALVLPTCSKVATLVKKGSGIAEATNNGALLHVARSRSAQCNMHDLYIITLHEALYEVA